MAVLTLLMYVIVFVVAYATYALFTPIMYTTRYENAMWDKMPASVIAFGDQIYGIWALIAIIIAAVILMAAWANANRARATQ